MTTFWGVACLVFLFVEIITVNLVTIWFSLGSLVALVASMYIESFVIQIIIFICSSLVALLLTKPIISRLKIKNIEYTNSDRYVGKSGVVIKKITQNERGQVKVMGSVWTAVSDSDIDEGTKIIVEKIEGVKLIVKKEAE